MGWSSWFSDTNGDSVREKSVNNNDGSSEKHYIRSSGGNKADHQHIVTNRQSNGRSTAHGYPNKSKR